MTQLGDSSGADLSKLGDQYEILSEIRRDERRALYLARHRTLGRDVVISVVRVPGGRANDELTHFTWDARLLATLKHDNVVPVVEGRWLDADTFAVVHALVRGSTLGEMLTAAGKFSPEKVASTLEQVRRALDWARTNGIIHRQLTTDTVSFQQGTGRAMLALGLTPLAPGDTPDACSDVRTLGMMAWSMLAGIPYESNAARNTNLAERRRDLDPAIVSETYAMIECRSNASRRDIGAYIAMLTAAPVAHAAPAYPIEAVPSQSNDAVVVVGKRTSPGPLATFAVFAAVAIFAVYFFLNHRHSETNVAITTTNDTVVSPGDVAHAPMNQAPPTAGSGAMASAPPVAPPIAPPTSAYYPTYPSTQYTPPPTYTPPPAPTQSPTTGSTVTGATTPMTITPPPARRDSPTVRDSVVVTKPTNPCDSPDAGDQRRCFDTALGRGDAELNRNYTDAIAALRRRANVADGDPDPQSVVDLRAEQRKWVEDRDAECRRRSDEAGSLWAMPRAQCFAEKAGQRARELATIISG